MMMETYSTAARLLTRSYNRTYGVQVRNMSIIQKWKSKKYSQPKIKKHQAEQYLMERYHDGEKNLQEVAEITYSAKWQLYDQEVDFEIDKIRDRFYHSVGHKGSLNRHDITEHRAEIMDKLVEIREKYRRNDIDPRLLAAQGRRRHLHEDAHFEMCRAAGFQVPPPPWGALTTTDSNGHGEYENDGKNYSDIPEEKEEEEDYVQEEVDVRAMGRPGEAPVSADGDDELYLDSEDEMDPESLEKMLDDVELGEDFQDALKGIEEEQPELFAMMKEQREESLRWYASKGIDRNQERLKKLQSELAAEEESEERRSLYEAAGGEAGMMRELFEDAKRGGGLSGLAASRGAGPRLKQEEKKGGGKGGKRGGSGRGRRR